METISQTPTNNDNRTTQIINTTNAILVGIIALISFALSYSNLQQIAETHGFDGTLSYAWPFLLDGALVVFSLSVVSAYLRSESTWRQWALVGLYTLVTVAFNILHAPNSPLAQVVPKGLVSLVVAMVAPTSLFFSFEMLMSQFKGQIARQNKMVSIQALTTLHQSLQDEFTTLQTRFTTLTDSVKSLDTELGTKGKHLETLDAQLEEKGLRLENLVLHIEEKQSLLKSMENETTTAQNGASNGHVETNKQENVTFDPKSKEARCNIILQAYTHNSNTSVTDLVTLTGVSRQTVYRDLRDLEQQGLINRDGETVIVTSKVNGGVK